jgi:hypothetical protein
MGCSRGPGRNDLQGEWVGDSASFYLKFDGDSLSYAHTSLSVRGHHNGQAIISQQFGTLAPLTPLRPFRISNDTLYVEDSLKQLKYLGTIGWENQRLSICLFDGADPITFSRLSYNPTFDFTSLQMSHSGVDRSDLIYDLELRDSVCVFHGTKRSSRDGYFRSSLSNGQSLAIRDIMRKVRFTRDDAYYRERASHWADVPEFGIALFLGDTIKSFLFNINQVPPDLIPLMTFVDSIVRTSTFTPIDTSYWFHSRLVLTYTLDDSLEYLEQFDSSHFQTAKYPGGFTALQHYLLPFVSSLPDSLFPYDFNVYLNEMGTVEKFEIRSANGLYTLPGLQKAMQKSKRWLPAIWEGKPIPEKKSVLFYTPRNGLVAG